MIQNPHRDFEIVDKDDLMQPRFQGWVQAITEAVNLLEPMEGAGSPEGVVFAPQKKSYIDIVGGIEYYKTTDKTLNTGWIAL